jgi:hypothetical protein
MSDPVEEQDPGTEADQIKAAIRTAGADFRTFFASPGYKAYRRFMEAEANVTRERALTAATPAERDEARALYLATLRVGGLQEHLREFVFEK